MQTLRSKLFALAAVVVLAVTGFLMSSRPAAAVPPPPSIPVTVVNGSANPVPVTGSTAISGGTVAATQSGPWNVSLTPGATVTVGNSATSPVPVNISNPAAAPLLFLNVNDPGRIPYQSNQVVNSCTGIPCLVYFTAVPSNQRLVVQHLSGVENGIAPGPTSVLVSLVTGSIGNIVISNFFAPVNGTQAAFDQPLAGYLDAGQVPQAHLGQLGSVVNLTLTGYLIDCSAAPCALTTN